MVFGSKKATVTAVGGAFITLVTVLLATYTQVPEEVITAIAGLLTAVVASYNVGQGLADFGTGGSAGADAGRGIKE